MARYLFNTPLGVPLGAQRNKYDLGIGALMALQAGGQLINGIVNGISQSNQNAFNAKQAEQQRQWASAEAAKSRSAQYEILMRQHNYQLLQNQQGQNWQEMMYNKYNSPAALMAQYSAAGLNPFLGASAQMGSPAPSTSPMSSAPSGGVPSVPSGAAATAASTIQPRQIDLLAAAQAESTIGNQHAQTLETKWRIWEDLNKKGNPEIARKFLESNPDMTQSEDTDSLRLVREYRYDMAMYDVQEEMRKTELAIYQKFGEKTAQAMFEKLDAEVTNAHAQRNVMQTIADLNKAKASEADAKVADLAASVLERAAHAMNLKAQIQVYDGQIRLMGAQADSLDGFRPLIAGNMALEFLRNGMITEEEFSKFMQRTGVRGWQESSAGKTVETVNSVGIGQNPALKFLNQLYPAVGMSATMRPSSTKFSYSESPTPTYQYGETHW